MTTDDKFLQEVVAIAFNHDSSMFAINVINNTNINDTNAAKYSGHHNLASQVLIYYTDPLILAYRFNPGYICRCLALLDRTNIIALVPIQKGQTIFTTRDLKNKQASQTLVDNLASTNSTNINQLYEPVPESRRRQSDAEHAYLYDCQLKNPIHEFSFKQPISRCLLSYAGNSNICASKSEIRFTVICRSTVFVLSMSPGEDKSKTSVETIDTGHNNKMLASVNLSGSVLICPAIRQLVSTATHGCGISKNANSKNLQNGVLQIVDLNRRKVSTLTAHKRELVYIELDHSGNKCATAGALGTIIRVWSVLNRNLLYELRRGSDPANIYSFSFASLGLINSQKLLIASSNKGTVHIWKTFGDSNVANSSRKIRENSRSDKDNIYTDVVNFIHQSGGERRSCCSFSVPPNEASFVKILSNRPIKQSSFDSLDGNNMTKSSITNDKVSNALLNNNTSSNLCAIVVTKSGNYYKFHVDINKEITGKLVKENLLEDGFCSSFG